MESLSYVLLGCLIVISPGADFVLVFKNSLSSGRRAGVLTGLGIGVGVCIHIIYSILGIGYLISQNLLLFSIIKYAGSAYLIYLGVMSILQANQPLLPQIQPMTPSCSNGRKYFFQGFLCNMLNPKTMLFFLSVFSQLVPSSPESSSLFALIYGVYISLLHILWFCLVALFVTSHKAQTLFDSVGRRINQACGVGLITFGVTLSLAK